VESLTWTLIVEPLTTIGLIEAAFASILQPPGSRNSNTPLEIAWIGPAIGAAIAAVATVSAGIISYRKDKEIAKLNGQIQQQSDVQDLHIEYDKDLRSHRIDTYNKLWSAMLPLARYPESARLTYDGAKKLSESMRDWFFMEGGLFLSEETREKYFDLQEGIKIVLQKRKGLWRFDPVEASKDADRLRVYLRRKEGWKPSESIVKIANSPLPALPASKDNAKDNAFVPEEIVENLLSLSHRLRAGMSEDLLTRRGSYLGMVQTSRLLASGSKSKGTDTPKTPKERDEELLNGLLKLDATNLELWRYFSDRADKFAQQLWTTGTWIFAIMGAVLALPFVAKFIVVDSEQLIRFQSRPLAILVCLFGLLLCAYSYVALKDIQEHLERNWERSDLARTGQWQEADWSGRKSHGWRVLMIFGAGSVVAFVGLIALALFWRS
jgi:hypothetical protein